VGTDPLTIDAGSSRRRIPIVDAEERSCTRLADDLGPRGFEVEWRTDAATAMSRLAAGDIDAVLVDGSMPGSDGRALCEEIAAARPDLPVTIVAHGNALAAPLAAIRAGAYDLVVEPSDPDVIALALGRAIQHRQLRDELRRLRRAVASPPPPAEIAVRSTRPRPEEPERDAMAPLEEIERRHILRVLDAVKGNRTVAARMLGVDRKTLYRKLGRYGAGA
jgi:DNA-binding NtrC family response regulator